MSLEDLATAVIGRAVLDTEARAPHVRDDARHFLAGGPMLDFWCDAANVRAATVQRALTRRRALRR